MNIAFCPPDRASILDFAATKVRAKTNSAASYHLGNTVRPFPLSVGRKISTEAGRFIGRQTCNKMFKLKIRSKGKRAIHADTLYLFYGFFSMLCLSVYSSCRVISVFPHLNLAHKLRLYIFLAVFFFFISLYKKFKKKKRVASEAESKSQT